MTAESLREQFLRSFKECIANSGSARLREAWKSQTTRTAFYDEIFERVAGSFDLRLEHQLLIVDYAMVTKDDVPRVFIESENIASSAAQEVRKLCCLASPLKVLFSVCEWDESFPWRRGSMRPRVLPAWRQVVAQHEAAGTFCGDIIAVVAEWRPDDILRFYSVSLRTPDVDVVLHECAISPPVTAVGDLDPVV